jgi:hypothetical protein
MAPNNILKTRELLVNGQLQLQTDYENLKLPKWLARGFSTQTIHPILSDQTQISKNFTKQV